MKSILLKTVAAILFACPAAVSAQGYIGIHGLASMPLTQMNKSGYGNGGGFGIEVLSNPLNAKNGVTPKVQLHIGGGAYYLLTGIKRYELMLDSPQTGKADVTTGNNVFALQVIGRVSTVQGRVGAYADVFGGLRLLNTSQTISPKIKSSDYEDETTTAMQNSLPATCGLGIGMLYRLSDNIFLDMGTAYTWGTKAKYIAMKDVYQEGNEIRYPTHRTTTDKLLFRLGVTFRLNFEGCGGSNGYNYELGGGNDYTPSRSRPGTRSGSGYKKPNQLKKNPAPKVDY